MPESPAAVAPPAEEASPGPALEARALVAFEPAAVDAEALAAALGVDAYEAGQRARRGGWQVLRTLPEADAADLVARLRQAGVRAEQLPEAETRAAGQPLVATGGGLEGEVLSLDTETAGPCRLVAADLLLIVRGPIVREYQAQETQGWRALKRVRLSTPQPGYRFHLHRRNPREPLELDPAAFAFRERAESAQLRIGEWCDALARSGVVQDDGFRRLTVALAVAAMNPGAEATAPPRVPRAGPDREVVLDNLAQFRAYSAWRGVLARRREERPPS